MVQLILNPAYLFIADVSEIGLFSDFAFINRLCEEEGIWYAFEQHGQHGDMVVFGDSPEHYFRDPSLPVSYRPHAGLESVGTEALFNLSIRHNPIVEGIRSADYNYRSADTDLFAETDNKQSEESADNSVLLGKQQHWGLHPKTPDEAEVQTTLLNEAVLCRQTVANGSGNVVSMAPMKVFQTDTAFPEAPDGWLVLGMEHSGSRDSAYSHTFTAIPAQHTFRPERSTPRPHIAGTLPARVTAAENCTYAYIDDMGRYRVKLPFDLDEWSPGGESRPVRLAKPYAGPEYGIHFPLPDATPIDNATPVEDALPNVSVKGSPVLTLPKVILSFKSRLIPPEDIRAKEGRLKDGGISKLTKDVYAIFPSHHQKTVLIDYEDPKTAVGFVMGHNMLEAYWDTSKHGRRGKSPNTGAFFPIPRQDVSSIVSGEVLHDLNDNFIKSWEKIAPEDADFVAARKSISRDAYRPNAKLGTKMMAQIVRTQPEKEFDREEVMALYGQLVKRSCAYLYFENQYFRWPPLADALREWGKTLIECGRKEPLCVFAVTNTSNEGLGAGRINTDRMLERLGRRDVMPGVGKARLTQELKQQEEELSDQLPYNWFGLREDTPQEARMRRQKQEAEQLRQELDRLSLEKDADLDKLRQILKKDLASEGLAVHVCRLVSTEVRERDADPKNGSNNAQEIYIHAKVAIADDAYLTLGSSNINTRSMQIDSELNIATEHGDTARKLRQELWGIHTGGNAGLNPAGHLNDPEEVKKLFRKWDDAMKDNKESFRKSAPLTMSLLEFEMLDPSVTPYKYDLD